MGIDQESRGEVMSRKVTKEMLAEMRNRSRLKLETQARFKMAKPPRVDLDPAWVIAVLDERKAHRAALDSVLPLGHDGEARAYTALALGEDE